MYLALETSSDQASVALGRPGTILVEETLPGVRQHARGLLPLIQQVLARQGVELADLDGVVVTDGPGSFTGLRIGAAVAKALVHARGLELWSAPSLLVQAAGCVPDRSGRILAVADALRGDIFAAIYQFPGGRIEVDVPPGVFRPAELVRDVRRPDVVAGRLRPELWASFKPWIDGGASVQVDARPSAGVLLQLLGRAGGLQRIEPDQVARWEPAYGRPAEAQAKWETAHGRPIHHPGGSV